MPHRSNACSHAVFHSPLFVHNFHTPSHTWLSSSYIDILHSFQECGLSKPYTLCARSYRSTAATGWPENTNTRHRLPRWSIVNGSLHQSLHKFHHRRPPLSDRLRRCRCRSCSTAFFVCTSSLHSSMNIYYIMIWSDRDRTNRISNNKHSFARQQFDQRKIPDNSINTTTTCCFFFSWILRHKFLRTRTNKQTKTKYDVQSTNKTSPFYYFVRECRKQRCVYCTHHTCDDDVLGWAACDAPNRMFAMHSSSSSMPENSSGENCISDWMLTLSKCELFCMYVRVCGWLAGTRTNTPKTQTALQLYDTRNETMSFRTSRHSQQRKRPQHRIVRCHVAKRRRS